MMKAMEHRRASDHARPGPHRNGCRSSCSSPAAGPRANALAGGGSFVTLASGAAGPRPSGREHHVDGRAVPRQIYDRHAGRGSHRGRAPVVQSTVLSSAGRRRAGCPAPARTPPTFFRILVPWLVLFAPGVFGWGSFDSQTQRMRSRSEPYGGQRAIRIAIDGGSFGGGSVF